MNKDLKYIFFGTGPLAESAIYALYQYGLIPVAIITKPDAPVGREQVMTAPMIKTWALSKGIAVHQPEKLSEWYLPKTWGYNSTLGTVIEEGAIDLAIVASYGKIIPEHILNIPRLGTLNIHPSLLPLYRGPSPIESQLLDGCESIGLSIMQLDKDMDHGPIYVQTEIPIPHHEFDTETIERICGRAGGELLTQIIPHIVDGVLRPIEQDHSKATYCKYVTKEMGEINLSSPNLVEGGAESSEVTGEGGIGLVARTDLLHKWRALRPWPGVFFFINHKDKRIRVKINSINYQALVNGETDMDKIILKVTPEGKKEMDWESFKRGYIE